MRKYFIAVSALVLSVLVCGCGDDKASKREDTEASASPNPAQAQSGRQFVADGQFRVNYPGEGYQWVLARMIEGDGLKGRVYACGKEGSNSVIVIAFEERAAASDAERVAALKGHYNGLVSTLRNGAFTDLKADPVTLNPPIPDYVQYSLTGKNPSGEAVHIHGATRFARNIYSFQAITSSSDEASQFVEVMKSFKELPPK